MPPGAEAACGSNRLVAPPGALAPDPVPLRDWARQDKRASSVAHPFSTLPPLPFIADRGWGTRLEEGAETDEGGGGGGGGGRGRKAGI